MTETQTSSLLIMAEPFDSSDPTQLIPEDKKLLSNWVDTLYQRGERTVYTKQRNELRYIGMPVGGICCGTVYLGGDGRLWVWDIFNQNTEGILGRNVEWDGFDGLKTIIPRDGSAYIEPHVNDARIAQGFALKIGDDVRPLDASSWKDVTFQGEYPLGIVNYADSKSPISMTLNAYSPFIPLNADDSGLPIVLMEFTLTNVSNAAVSMEFGGWMENIVRFHSAATYPGSRVNSVEQIDGMTVITSRYEALADAENTDDRDLGTLALAFFGTGVAKADVTPESLFDAPDVDTAARPSDQRLIGAVTHAMTLEPGESKTVTYAIAWHFPNSGLIDRVPDAQSGNYYTKRFDNAASVIAYASQNYERLSMLTKLWNETWVDSTLPYWFLDRTFVNTSILATSTAHRFATGRFWGWEGVGSCAGTCTHVWHYAQAVGRIFPELERDVRERVDFGVALDPATGMIGHRGEETGPAIDGQSGRILGVYREHQMSADPAFLTRLWPNVRKAMEYLIHHDSDNDGLIDGAQENTLDAAWFGKIAWLSGLYAAALRACELMAWEIGDTDFANLCHEKFVKSKSAIETQLFNGEYFIQIAEPGNENKLGTYDASHIDQVQGQSWAWQLGLGRVLDCDKTLSALRALYKYNFAPDIGPYRCEHHGGRPYALAGEGGLIMTTNPKNVPNPYGNVSDWQYGYFNECMSGFEHQVASHLIAEGMILEGLAVTRAIHDRYHASRRNPYNEIECSDHYSRAMASYGSFIAMCGFEYHGPSGHLSFDPRVTPEDFRAPFTVAEGWGTFQQTYSDDHFSAELTLRHGQLRLKTLSLTVPADRSISDATVTLNGQQITASQTLRDGRITVAFSQSIVIVADQSLSVKF